MPYKLKDINQLLKEANQKYTTVIYKVSATVTYVCHAEITGEVITVDSPVWRIMKIDETSETPTKISYADFTDTFNKIASSYNTYTYL